MKTGICIVTCDRIQHLRVAIESLEWRGVYAKVIVDNGGHTGVKVQKLAARYKYGYINGNQSNCPHGQNLGLDYLAEKGCDVVLKSDDDVKYEVNCLPRLVDVFGDRRNRVRMGAVGAAVWSDETEDVLTHRGHNWVDSQGKVAGENLVRHRFDRKKILKVRHLHCSFLYDVQAALELKAKTLKLRGGAFPEYLSHVAFREETEFTYLLWAYMKSQVLLATDAVAYHCYAPGGIRKHERGQGLMSEGDEEKVRRVIKKLTGYPMKLSPAWLK